MNHKQPKPEPNVAFMIRIPVSSQRRLMEHAKREYRKQATMATLLIEEALRAREKP